MNIMRHTAVLMFNPIMRDSNAFLFNCTLVGQVSDSIMVPT